MDIKTVTLFIAATLFILSGCDSQKAEAVSEAENNKTEAPAKTHSSPIPAKAKSQHREWYSFEEGIRVAEAEKKHVIIDFYTDWCKWCKVMDEKTFSQPDVEAFLFEHFVPIRLDAESNEQVSFKGQTYSFRQLTSAFGVTGFPSLAYLTPDIELITIVPGYIEKPMFLDILTYMSQACYAKNIPFDQFKSNPDCISPAKTAS